MQRREFNFSPHRALTAACIAAACLIAATPRWADAGTIVIDRFTAPAVAAVQAIKLLNPGPKVLVKQDDPEVLGIERDVLFEVAGTPQNSAYTGTIGNGVFVYAAGTRMGTVATLQYDGDDADVPGANPSLVDNLNIGNGSPFDLTDGLGAGAPGKFVLEFLSAQAGPDQTSFEFEIRAVSTGGSAVFTGNIAENPNPFTREVDFDDFTPTGSFSFTQLRSLTVVLNKGALPAADFELDLIQVVVVPEPGSLSLLACGGAVAGLHLVRRRRRATARR